MPQTGSSFRFSHSVAAVIQQLRLSLGGDAQKSLGDTAALLDDRDRQLEDFLSGLDVRIGTTAGVPSGGMFEWAGGTAPDGYLLCDGSAVSRSEYPSLFTAIGTVWGVGDGSTTFNVPDFRGRVTIGSGAGPSLTPRTVGQKGGEERHALTSAENGPHFHVYNQGSSNFVQMAPEAGAWPYYHQQTATNTAGSGSGTPHNTMQPFAVVTKIIKT